MNVVEMAAGDVGLSRDELDAANFDIRARGLQGAAQRTRAAADVDHVTRVGRDEVRDLGAWFVVVSGGRVRVTHAPSIADFGRFRSMPQSSSSAERSNIAIAPAN